MTSLLDKVLLTDSYKQAELGSSNDEGVTAALAALDSETTNQQQNTWIQRPGGLTLALSQAQLTLREGEEES